MECSKPKNSKTSTNLYAINCPYNGSATKFSCYQSCTGAKLELQIKENGLNELALLKSHLRLFEKRKKKIGALGGLDVVTDL